MPKIGSGIVDDEEDDDNDVDVDGADVIAAVIVEGNDKSSSFPLFSVEGRCCNLLGSGGNKLCGKVSFLVFCCVLFINN